MTLDAQIINDLHAGQTTSHSLALRIAKPTTTVETTLIRLEKEGRVTRRPICDGRLIVWMPSKAQNENSAGAAAHEGKTI